MKSNGMTEAQVHKIILDLGLLLSGRRLVAAGGVARSSQMARDTAKSTLPSIYLRIDKRARSQKSIYLHCDGFSSTPQPADVTLVVAASARTFICKVLNRPASARRHGHPCFGECSRAHHHACEGLGASSRADRVDSSSLAESSAGDRAVVSADCEHARSLCARRCLHRRRLAADDRLQLLGFPRQARPPPPPLVAPQSQGHECMPSLLPPWLGHRDVSRTMTCAHALNRGPGGVPSPLDRCPVPRGAKPYRFIRQPSHFIPPARPPRS
jgi:hypothetical protein